MIALLDLDGVSADFHGAAMRLMGDAVVTTPQHRALGKDFRISYDLHSQIWKNIEAAGAPFWANLEPTPWLPDLLEVIGERFNELFIVTSPGVSTAVGVVDGKLQWCKKYIPQVHPRNIIFTGQKHLLADRAGYKVLIDDSEDIINKYRSNGGRAFMVPQPWNRDFALTPEDVPELLKRFLDQD